MQKKVIAFTSTIRRIPHRLMKEEATREERCMRCGALLEARRAPLKEIALNCLCAMLLLAVMVLIVYLGDRWINQCDPHLFPHPIWHELLEEWSSL